MKKKCFISLNIIFVPYCKNKYTKMKLCDCQNVTLERMVTCVMKRVGTVKIRPSVTIVTERVWLDVWLAFKVPCVKHVSMLNIASIFIQKYAFDLFDFFYTATVIGLKYCRQCDFWRETLSNHSYILLIATWFW